MVTLPLNPITIGPLTPDQANKQQLHVPKYCGSANDSVKDAKQNINQEVTLFAANERLLQGNRLILLTARPIPHR